MSGLSTIVMFLTAVMVVSELVLGGTRLQTGLARVLVVWAVCYIATVWTLDAVARIGPVATTIFWSGAFLTWFGVRSHIESSILLRMLYLLRGGAMSESELTRDYIAQCGEAVRLEELVRGGLVLKIGERLSTTAKGRIVLRVASKL